jgi:small-conductance mechanosensitive channel
MAEQPWLQTWLKQLSLEREILGNTLVEWALAIGAFLLANVVLRLLKRFIDRRAGTLAEPQSLAGIVGVRRMLAVTQGWALTVLAFYQASLLLEVPPRLHHMLEAATAIVVLFQIGLWLNVLLAFSIELHAERQMQYDAARVTTLSAIGFLGRWILWTLIGLLALDNLGVNVTTLLASLGVGGIAVALAAQSILKDLLASLSIVLDQPFVLGDFIAVADVSGTVEFIGLRTTHIRSLSGEQIVLANSDLMQSRIRNFKRMQERRAVFNFFLEYRTPPEKLERVPQLVREIIEQCESVRFDRAHFKAFGAGGLEFEAVFYLLRPDYGLLMDTQQRINLALCRRLAAEQISMAMPAAPA